MYYLTHFVQGFLSLESGKVLIEDLRLQHHLHLGNALASWQMKTLRSRGEANVHSVPGAMENLPSTTSFNSQPNFGVRIMLPRFKVVGVEVQGLDSLILLQYSVT